MSAVSAIEELMALHPKGFDLSLERISGLLAGLGNPHLRIPPAFHVAGTNGKGSVTAFLRAIIEAHSKTVHVHTSPHLVNWHERYRLGSPNGGELVTDALLEDAVRRVAAANAGRHITVFEIMSAVGFLLFSEHQADHSVLEVGLGGRFDATNVIHDPLVSVITPIGMDHQAYLGSTIAEIAFEKAGIIKSGRPVVSSRQQPAAEAVIERVALEKGAPLSRMGVEFDCYEQSGRMIWQDETRLFDLPVPRLLGDHQIANAGLAIAAAAMGGINLDADGLETAMQNVYWPGRLERLQRGRIVELFPPQTDIWIDGGHNPHAGLAIASEMKLLSQRDGMPFFMICGMLTTKEPVDYFRAFEGIADAVCCIPVSGSDSGFPPKDLAAMARKAGLESGAAPGLEGAAEWLGPYMPEDDPARILVCGSLYLVGEVLELNGTPPR